VLTHILNPHPSKSRPKSFSFRLEPYELVEILLDENGDSNLKEEIRMSWRNKNMRIDENGDSGE